MSKQTQKAGLEPAPTLGALDLHLFGEGTHARLWERLGAHPSSLGGVVGSTFALWAPNAERVSVIGPWNGWDPALHALRPAASSGLWSGFVPGAGVGSPYKYHVVPRGGGPGSDRADPFAFATEPPPATASVVCDLDYAWGDGEWMATRGARNAADAPISIYEVHLGSWRRVPEEGGRSLGYRELAARLVEYVLDAGFTHVELMPVTEHPFYGSWGYQTTSYFAPTARYGTPQDLMGLVDALHRAGIGVILDWVPAHFPEDAFALAAFDGTCLYEHADPRKGVHPDWNTRVFNYGRHEVRSFLLSSALFWLERYHIDGLRVDAVASMLYLDYSRRPGEWVPNEHGGRENLEAVAFLRQLNEEVRRRFPDVQTFAEESTAWPGVSRPTHVGGLGFGFKWDMGWMHDALAYFGRDPVHRRHHHREVTFRGIYQHSERFVLPLSHDEVVHGKGSLLSKMPGDDWQRFANLRLLLAWQWAQPGKKLLFMGGEFGQWREWCHDESLDWHLLERAEHRGILAWVRDLNRLLRAEPALHALDHDPLGFEWIDCSDSEQSVVALLRAAPAGGRPVLAVFNFTPVPRRNYRVGAPAPGFYRELLNGDGRDYGGSGQGNLGGVEAAPVRTHGRPHSLNLTLPPLGATFLAPEGP